MNKIYILFFALLIFCGCETIAKKEDILYLKNTFSSKIKKINKKIEDLERENNKKFASISENIEGVKNEIREVKGKIGEVEYNLSERINKGEREQQNKNFEFRRDIEALKKSQNDMVNSITLLNKSLFSIQKDIISLKNSQREITETIGKISKIIEKDREFKTQLKKDIDKKIQILLDEITRHESQIYNLKQDILSLRKQLKEIPKERISEGKEIYYTVKKGDCLYKIARKFNTTVKKIRKRNKLKGNTIYPGQKLIIPK